MKAKRVLAVGAHPDDEVIGAGGTLARLAAQGCDVRVLILSGVTTSRDQRSHSQQHGELDQEAEGASRVLGIEKLYRFTFQDNRFDSVPLLEIVKAVESVKTSFFPDTIFTHDFSDLNVDHRLTHQAVLTAFRPTPGKPTPKILSFEVLSSTEYQDQALSRFIPNYYSDIHDYLEKKLEAMSCYKSELCDYPHPRSLQGISIAAQRRGLEVGLPYAEAFRLIREVW